MEPSAAKRPAISIVLLLVIVALAVIAYFAAPTVMTYIMLQVERARATGAPVAPDSFGTRPEGLSIGGGSPETPEGSGDKSGSESEKPTTDN